MNIESLLDVMTQHLKAKRKNEFFKIGEQVKKRLRKGVTNIEIRRDLE